MDCAAQVHITLFYLKKWHYEPETFVDEVIDEDRAHRFISDEDEEDEQREPEIGSREWLHARLEETLAPWSKHNSEIYGLNSVWMKDGIAHYWSRDAEWYAELHEAAEDALEVAKQVEEEQ